MPKEKSAGAVVFRKEDNKIYYLLLQYQKGHWDFPKGHMEPGERELETVKREVAEETGIKNLELFPNFRQAIYYFFSVKEKTIFKTVAFYLAKTEEKEVKISHEHINFIWLAFPEAMAKLTFKNAKKILRRADEFLLKTQS